MNGLSDETIREIAVTAGKSVEFVQGITNYISDIIGDPIKLGVQTFVTDPLSTFRNIKLIEFMSNVQTKMIEKGVTDVKSIAPKIVLPLLDSAILEDEPILQEMWENLLVSAVLGHDVEKDYVKTMDLFTPSTAVFLSYLYSNRSRFREATKYEVARGELENVEVFTEFSFGNLNGKVEYSEHDIRSLIRFGIVDSTYREVNLGEMRNSEETIYISNGTEEFTFTDFGLDFAQKVISESKREE